MADEKDLNLKHYQVRTDLAIEAHQIALEENERRRGDSLSKKNERTKQDPENRKADHKEDGIPGVHVDMFEKDGIEVTKVHIETEEGAKEVGKLPGRYLTVEARGLRQQDTDYQDQVTTLLAAQMQQFLQEANIKADARCLIVGLGNWNVTPDALGPIVVENMLVTNHLFELQPEQVEEGFRAVSAITPGVMGITGLETSEIVRGIVERSKPDFVIAIDALASRSIERLNTTIQISDTGIHPGSGVGNKRKGLNESTLGVPVIAIGVPTVVDAVSIVSDTLDFVMGHLGQRMEEEREGKHPRRALAPGGMNFAVQEVERFDPSTIPDEEGRKVLMGIVGTLGVQEKRQLIREVLQPLGHHLIVTPKEVDDFIEDMGNIIANALNAALHEQVNMDNVSAYTH